MAKGNLKLTSVKIVDHLFEDFKVSSIRYKFNLQKLANRAVHLYLTDENFRKNYSIMENWIDQIINFINIYK